MSPRVNARALLAELLTPETAASIAQVLGRMDELEQLVADSDAVRAAKLAAIRTMALDAIGLLKEEQGKRLKRITLSEARLEGSLDAFAASAAVLSGATMEQERAALVASVDDGEVPDDAVNLG